MENLSKILVLAIFLSSCALTTYTVDPIYEDHPHTTEIYYNNMDVYFGYYSGFYYYYGTLHVHCDNGHYVYSHRGPTINNNVAKDFTPTIKIKNNKDKSFVFPRNWKSNNSTRTNKQNNYNINKINYNRTFNQTSNTNTKPTNINRSNKSNKKSRR